MSKNALAEINLIVLLVSSHIHMHFSFPFLSLVLTLCSLMVDNRVFICTKTYKHINKKNFVINPYYNLFHISSILSPTKHIMTV